MNNAVVFDELTFFAQVKKRTVMYLAGKSLLSLRDHLYGMGYAFSACDRPDALKMFHLFIEYYNSKLLQTDQNGYVCWWNHLMYISGGSDADAFDAFFREFEAYLLNAHHLQLPEVQ